MHRRQVLSSLTEIRRNAPEGAFVFGEILSLWGDKSEDSRNEKENGGCKPNRKNRKSLPIFYSIRYNTAEKGTDMKRSNNTLFKDIRSHEVKARERILAAARGTYTVMDIETTGMYSDITEIAALRVVSGEIRDTFHTLVKAKGPIEKRVERLTGITSDMLEGQPPIGDVLPIFMTFIEGFPLVGHGLDSDLVVIDRNLKAVGKPLVTNDYIDTHSLAKLLLPEREGEHRKYSVKALAEYYELPCSTFHRAMDDCMAEKMLFERLLAEWK